MTVNVLDVGQCGFDHSRIRSLLTGHFNTQVDRAHTADDVLEMTKSKTYQLILVNRIFDEDGDSGIDLIRRLQQSERTESVPVMLVSNFADAQAQATRLGALPGFGKSELDSLDTVEKLSEVLGVKS